MTMTMMMHTMMKNMIKTTMDEGLMISMKMTSYAVLTIMMTAAMMRSPLSV